MQRDYKEILKDYLRNTKVKLEQLSVKTIDASRAAGAATKRAFAVLRAKKPKAMVLPRYMFRRGVALAVVLMALFFIPVMLYNNSLQPVGPGSPTMITIPPGSTAASISVLLEKENLIRNSMTFTLAVRLNKLGSSIKAGTYDLAPNMGALEILDKLVRGDVVNLNIRVTIPEGMTIPFMGELFERRGFFTKEEFIEAAKTIELPYEYLKAVPDTVDFKMEGYLFPDTYEFSPHLTPEQVIRTMASRFNALIPPRYEASEIKNKYTLHQVVTMASVVEKEAVKNDERGKIAGVFYNRLGIGWRLQSCATVQYILGTPRALLYVDLEIPSPYNTYLHGGLPPGAIASAGLSSFEAALSPESHDLLFFVARPDGSHIFTRTNAEHEQAIRQIASGK